MSHVSKISVIINSIEALKDACKQLGLEFVEGKTQYKWWGRWMRDSPLPEGFKESDLGKCAHVIKIPNNATAYEVGVVKNPNGEGFLLMYDYYSGGYGLETVIGKQAKNLIKEYSASRTKLHYKKLGWRVNRTVKDGKIILKAIQ